MPRINKVIIIGAGPAGLAAALHLHTENQIKNIAIYEIRDEPSTIGGALAIPANGLRLIERLGLYDAIVSKAALTPDVVIHSHHGDELGRFPFSPKYEPSLDLIRMRRKDLMATLYAAIEPCNIPIHFSKKLVNIQEFQDGVTVTFSDGITDTADLLLGCDGIHSVVRTTHVDPDCNPEYSGISTVFCIVPTSSLPDRECFPLMGMHGTLTSEGIFACLPCTADEKDVYWFSNQQIPPPDKEASRDGWIEHRKHEIANFKTTMFSVLQEVGGPWGELLRSLVNASTTLSFFPVYRLPLGGKWYKGTRCVLLGDAAHAMQIHVGQGVSMALEDVFVLSRLLKQDIPLEELLGSYIRTRSPRVETMYRVASETGSRIKRYGPWELWFTAKIASWRLWLGNLLGKTGMGGEDLSYDAGIAELL